MFFCSYRYFTLPVHDHLWFIAIHKPRDQLPDCTYTLLSSSPLSWYTFHCFKFTAHPISGFWVLLQLLKLIVHFVERTTDHQTQPFFLLPFILLQTLLMLPTQMSQLPSQSPVQPAQFSGQSLSIGASGSQVGPSMDSAILSLTHTTERAGAAPFTIDGGAQVHCVGQTSNNYYSYQFESHLWYELCIIKNVIARGDAECNECISHNCKRIRVITW